MSKAFVGKPASVYAVVGKDFKRLSLVDFQGKYVVLCSTWNFHYDDFVALNSVVLADSTYSKFCHLERSNKFSKNYGLGEVKIPLIAHMNPKLCRDYGVLKEDEGVNYRGLFIVDPDEIVRQIFQF